MSNDETVSRRTVLKILGAGGAGIASAPNLFAQHPHPHTGVEMVSPNDGKTSSPLRFFTASEMTSIASITALIIPSDEHSPGANDAGVPAFIDLMVSESPVETKNLWRNGLAAVNQLCTLEFSHEFASSTPEQQVAVLKLISRNEYAPRTIEERFFIAIKGLTVDGYYTSELGIHQELRYKGNAYLKDFAGCTHPEHTS